MYLQATKAHIVGTQRLTYTYACNNYSMGTSALPDMYARSPRAAGPRAEGMHIRHSTRAHVITNILHFRHS